MKRKNVYPLLGFIFFLSISSIYGQRYVEEISQDITQTSAVLYSKDAIQPMPSERTYLPKNMNIKEHNISFQDLFMDIYEITNDAIDKRPALVLCHGGGFVEGNKSLGDIKELANTFAKKGYLVATIDYRLGINVMDKVASQRAIYRGVQDSRAAIRFLRANATVYAVDSNNIFLAGVSSGGIIALHNIYLNEDERTQGTKATTYNYSEDGVVFENFGIPDLGCLDCVGNNQNFSGTANAVVAFAGAIGDLNFIDGATNAPSLLFHSRDDNVVPYECGVPYNRGFTELEKVFGSKAIADRAEMVGATVELVSFDNSGHNVHTPDGTQLYPEVITKMTSFLFDIIHQNGNTLSLNNQIQSQYEDFTLYPNPVKDLLYVKKSKKNIEEIKIRNLQGKLILVANNNYTIDLKSLSEGTYILTVKQGAINSSKLFVKSN